MLQVMKTLCSLIVLMVGLPALADVPPSIDRGKEFVEHRVGVTNMAKHPDWVLMVYDASSNDRIRAHLTFRAGGAPETTLVNGQSWRSTANFSSPKVWLVPAKAADAWQKATMTEIARQRKACADRGEGCAHISRFSPKYAPPAEAVDCKASISVVSQRKKDTSSKPIVVDSFKLLKASATECRLEHLAQKKTSEKDGGVFPWVWITTGGILALCGVLMAFMMRRREDPNPSVA